MEFHYELVRLWERPAEELLAADLGLTPLAVLGQLPDGPLDDALATVVHQIVERVTKEAPPERATKLLTDALLLTGLRVRREMARKIFRGVRMMEESDTYLMIREEGEEKATRQHILLIGQERFGSPSESITSQLKLVADLDRLERMFRCAMHATSWQEILDTP